MNIDNLSHHINITNPDITIYILMQFLQGWGLLMVNRHPQGSGISQLEHVNVLELKAIEIGIYTYCKTKIGGIKSQTFNNIASRMWYSCTKNQLWVSAALILGTINIEADKQSRVL